MMGIEFVIPNIKIGYTMRYFLKLLMVVAALFLNVGLGLAFELVPKDGESIYCIGNKGDDSKYFGHPKVFTAFSISDEEIHKRSKTRCEPKVLGLEQIENMLSAEDKILEPSYFSFLNEYEIKNETYKFRLIFDSPSFAVDWLDRKNEYEKLEKECGFRGFSEKYNLMEIDYHGQGFCSAPPSRYFEGIVKTDDGGELIAKCRVKEKRKICYMEFFFKDWQVFVGDIQGEIISEWSDIRKAVLADLENKLLIYYVAPDICVGDVCEEFLNEIK